ncbi:MAG: hypothetical protein H0W73_15860 [Bacteroidetes bacterium]|nr:hypothetical protein [Bacteroidota bacterium]
MTTKLFSTLALAGILFTSCGNKKETTTETAPTEEKKDEAPAGDFAGSCTSDTKLTVAISDYKFGVKEKVKFDAPNFEVKKSTWMVINDSCAKLTLMNYTDEERAAGRTDKQADINVEFKTKKGKKLASGSYGYMDYESGMAAMVTINVLAGKVYFNGNDQGNVVITYFDKDHICGMFDLMVDQPASETVGSVKLNGTFKVENK